MIKSLLPSPFALGPLLRKYFRSGWAFLIPYLAAYLLYWWLRWAINPISSEGGVKVASASGPLAPHASHLTPPALLHVYWALHAINAVLAVIALVSWWREQNGDIACKQAPTTPLPPFSPVRFSQEAEEEAQGIATRGTKGSRILRILRRFVPKLRPPLGSSLQEPLGAEPRSAESQACLDSSASVRPASVSSVTRSAAGPPEIACKRAPTAPSASLPPVRTDTPAAHGAIACEQAPTARFADRLRAFLASLLPPVSCLRTIAPWALLALLFFLPGVYLEFPADPWEHYGRINEWSWLHLVGEHSAWNKSSYFLAYSLLGQISPPIRQLFWLDFYYTGACLLLCWQYYRLARVVGLGERASFIFVLVQAFTFGNNIFGFYRYYGISSSIFAQLGAVALIRIAIDAAKGKRAAATSFTTEDTESTEAETGAQSISHEGTQRAQKESPSPALCDPCDPLRLTPIPDDGIAAPVRSQLPDRSLGVDGSARHPLSSGLRNLTSGLWPLASGLWLLALIAFNHVQGLGIAGLGLLAVVIWRLIEWRRSMIFWLAGAAVVLSVAAILWWPRHPALDEVYRPQGWLTSWYGFNLLSPSSPAFDRTLQLLGAFGAANLLASLLLLRCNHVAGWLTVLPFSALWLPFIAIPFTSLLAAHAPQEAVLHILVFHRMLLTIPTGLALVVFISNLMKGTEHAWFGAAHHRSWRAEKLHLISLLPALPSIARKARGDPLSLLLVALIALLLVPANGPYYNRFWNALLVPPGDLCMDHVVKAISDPAIKSSKGSTPPRLLTTFGQGFAACATGVRNVAHGERLTWTDPGYRTRLLLGSMTETAGQKETALLLVPPTAALDSPVSLSGYLSRHWPAQEAALEYAARHEIEAAARKLGGREIKTAAGTYYLFGDWKAAVRQDR